MKTRKILLAEDDDSIRMGICDILEEEGYRVTCASDGGQALRNFSEGEFSLVILDIMMPRVSGYEVCREIRRTSRVPVIMLTAKGEEVDKVVGLELGADDYITKPFSVRELRARIHALMRRVYGEGRKSRAVLADEPFDFGGMRIDPEAFRGMRDGNIVEFTPREIELLRYFSERPGKAVSRQDLMHAVWGMDYGGASRTVDQHIVQLRRKIEPEPGNPQVLTTVHGFGYRYQD